MSSDSESYYTPSRRSGHIAACYDNVLLVWGGYREIFQQDVYLGDRYFDTSVVWIYNSIEGKWNTRATSNNISAGISGACACLIDKRWYVFGGYTEGGNSNELYYLDLETWTWHHINITEESRKPSPRNKLAAWSYSNRLFIFGGYGPPIQNNMKEHGQFDYDDDPDVANLGWNNQVFEFDSLTDSWSNVACSGFYPSSRAAHSVTCAGNKAYLFGGRHKTQRLNDLHILDMDTFTWSGSIDVDGHVPCPRSWHTLTYIGDTKMFLYGGYSHDGRPLGDAWLLDIGTLQWIEMHTKNELRVWHTACCTKDQDIIIFGGSSTDLLSYTAQAQHNNVLTFRISPSTLLRLCLKATYRYRNLLQQELTSIPAHLQSQLVKEAENDGQNSGQTIQIEQPF